MGKPYSPAFILFFFLVLSTSVSGQKILLLEKAGTVNNYKYHVNEPIVLKVNGVNGKVKGTINKLTDTSMVLDFVTEIKFRSITDIYRPTWVGHWLPEVFIKASIGYFLVVGINNLLQHVYPVMPSDVIITVAALAGAGAGLSYLLTRHYKLSKGWRIRLIDFDHLPSK